jgi:hypothetical protein
MTVHLSTVLPLLIEHRIIIVEIFLWVFLSLTLPGLEQKIKGMTNVGISNQSLCNIELLSSNLDFCKSQAWGMCFDRYISCHIVISSWLSLHLRHAQFAIFYVIRRGFPPTVFY